MAGPASRALTSAAPHEDAVLGCAPAAAADRGAGTRAPSGGGNQTTARAGDMWGDCGLVFTTRLGDPVDPRNFHRDFKLRAAKAGVPVVPIHSTRRTCASLLVAIDVHPRVAMAVLRHNRIALTMEIYSQVSSTSTRDALKRLGGELAGS